MSNMQQSSNSSPSALQSGLPAFCDSTSANDSDDYFTTPSSSNTSIENPSVWAAEALQVIHSFETLGEEAITSGAFLMATMDAACSENPATRSLALSALFCFRCGFGLVLGDWKVAAAPLEERCGAIFPWRAYDYLRSLDDDTLCGEEVLADIMPNGTECISLLVRRLSHQTLLHAHDLHINSGIPVAIRRLSHAHIQTEQEDSDNLLGRPTREAKSNLTGREDSQEGIEIGGKCKEDGKCGRARSDGVMDASVGVAAGDASAGEKSRKPYRVYDSRLTTSAFPEEKAGNPPAQAFPSCIVSVDVSPAITDDQHQGDSFQFTNRVVVGSNPSIKLEKVWCQHELSPVNIGVRYLRMRTDVFDSEREFAVSQGSVEARTLSGGVAADLAIESRPIAGTGGLLHVPTPTGTIRGSLGGSGSRSVERTVSETVNRRYRCVDAGHQANRHHRLQLDADPSHPQSQDWWLPVDGFAYTVGTELAETVGPSRQGSVSYDFAAQVKATYFGPTPRDRLSFLLVNRIHVDDITKWDHKPFTCHDATYSVRPVPQEPFLKSSDRTPGEQMATDHHVQVSDVSTSQTSRLSAHAVAARINFCADWNSAVLIYDS